MNSRMTTADLERILSKIEGQEGQKERARMIRAELERRRLEADNG